MEHAIDRTGDVPVPFQGHTYGMSLLATFAALLLVSYLTLTIWCDGNRKTQEPQSLWDPIPFVFNTLQFLTRNDLFMERAV